RNHQRKLAAERLPCFERCEDRRFSVERVEDRLDQNEIDAALDESIDLLAIDRLHLVEVDLPEGGIVDVGRERQRLVRRPERTRDPALLAVLRTVAVDDLANDLRRRA